MVFISFWQHDPEYNDGTMNRPTLPQRTEVATTTAQSVKQAEEALSNNSVLHEEVAYDNPGYARDTTDSSDIAAHVNEENARNDEQEKKQPFYSPLDRSSLQIPQPTSYTSLRESQQLALNVHVDEEGYQVPTPKEDPAYFEVEKEAIHINPRGEL